MISVSALNLLLRLKGAGTETIPIAREIALDIREKDVIAHIPGVANKAAYLLSRWAEPGHSAVLLPCLARARQAGVPERTNAWYRAQSPPLREHGQWGG